MYSKRSILTVKTAPLKGHSMFTTENNTRTSSVDALELFTSDPGAFDLVVSDVTMPQMIGQQMSK